MKLNEQELNYILSECLQNMLNEDFTPSQIQNAQNNRTYNNNIEVNGNGDGGVNDPRNNRTRKKWRSVWKPVIKAGATAFGITAIGALFGSSNIGNLLGTLTYFGGIAAALQMVGASHRRYDILNKMQIPRNADMAKQVASLAAAERISLQLECKNLQGNYKNAEKAYNILAQAWNVETVSWDKISKQIGNNFSITEALGGGEREVNINTNFNNQNVTESKLYEANLNANDYNQKIISVSEFNISFKDNNGDFNIKKGLETVAGIASLYKETYTLWYRWTRYIQVLIKYFPNDLKWDEVMKTAGTVKPDSIWNTLYHKVFPKMSQFTDALSGRNSDDQEREDIRQNIKDTYSTYELVVYSLDTELSDDYQRSYHYVIIKDENTDELYAINRSVFVKKFPNIIVNNIIKINGFKQYVTSNKLYDIENNEVTIVKSSVVEKIKPA